jgi:flagellar FliJ protein
MYRFNLESLLRHRKFIEDAKQKDLALVQGQLNYEQRQLMVLKEEQIQSVNAFKKRQSFNLQAQEFCMFRGYSAHLNKKIKAQQKTIENVEKKVNIARTELLSAVKNRKILEKLKEKKKKEFLREKTKREQKLSNEAAVGQYNRKKL